MTREALITARFAGTCHVCGKPFAAGTEIRYAKSSGSRHPGCHAPAAAAAPAFTPTAEQQVALKMFATGKSLVIEAGAGAGKTSTLKLLALSTPRRGQYIAFNAAIVKEAKGKMPKTVNASTAHSLAYRAIMPGTRYPDRMKNSRRIKSMEIATMLRIEGIRVTLQDGTEKKLAASYLAGVAMRGVLRFCQSADEQPEARHVPYIDGIDVPPGARANNQVVAKALVPAMRRAWADIVNEHGVLPFRHDHYLKMWQLSKPRINAAYILFDEAQDANPVLLDIVKRQTHAQLVWVGDSQQQIYSFTGAINALQQVGAEQTAYLSQSFRFGPAIAEVANRVLDLLDADLRLTGTDSIPSRVAPVVAPSVILSRTNAAAVRAALEGIKEGKRIHIVGGGRDVVDFAKAAQQLQNGEATDHPELACFATWDEVQEYVAQDEQGGDLRLLVKLIDEFTVETILEALEDMPDEADADLVVSTAHKAKGREWDSVQLASDFPAEAKSDEELRLLYVAVTRAKLHLDITAVEMLTAGQHLADPAAIDHLMVGGATLDEAENMLTMTADEHAAVHARKPLGQLLAEERSTEAITPAERAAVVASVVEEFLTEDDIIDEAAKNGEYDITPAARAAVEALLEPNGNGDAREALEAIVEMADKRDGTDSEALIRRIVETARGALQAVQS